MMIYKDNDVLRVLKLIFLNKRPEIVGERTLNLFGKILGCQEGAVIILNAEIGQFEFLCKVNLEEKTRVEIESLIEEGVVDWTLEKKTPLFIPSEKNFIFPQKGFVLIPFGIKNKKMGMVGAFYLVRENFYSLKQEVIDLLTFLANLTSLGMENYLLREEINRRRKERVVFQKIFQSIEYEGEIDGILKSILKLILEETQSQYGFFLKIDKKKKKLSPWVSVNIPQSSIRKCIFSLEKGVVGYVVSTGKPLIIDEYSRDPRFKDSGEFNKLSPRNLISVPLKIKDKDIGVLTLCNTVKKPFYTKDDLYLLFSVGDLVAVIVKEKLLSAQMQQSFFDTINTLIKAVEAKDPHTSGHSHRVTELSLQMAEHLGLSQKERELIRLCGPLHDIGKIGISDSVLKKPSYLNDEEYTIVKKHPIIGEKIVEGIRFLRPGLFLIRHHHERYDGTGYPNGLKGEEIPLLARILSVADAFDAMVSHRPYRKALTVQQAMRELKRNAGSQFDPRIVEVFCKILKKSF